MIDDGTVGVYVHVPFCERVCPYCDFAVVAARDLPAARAEAYASAVVAELEARRTAFAGRRLHTIYFGGGTPSLCPPEVIGRLVDAIRGAFEGAPAEVTLEVNPSTVERERLPGFRAAGVDRLSIGLQSLSDTTLKRLGRAHAASEGEATVVAASAAGFERISLDLIFAAPGQSVGDVEEDAARLVSLGPEHVSAYALTLEEGTPFASAAARGRLTVPDDDQSADMMLAVARVLRAHGYERYETSSHAKPGAEARHNQRYWERRPILGVGVGAWSLDPPSESAPHGIRRGNERSLAAYLDRVAGPAARRPPSRDALSEAASRAEAAFLSLRMRRGLRASAFVREFGVAPRAAFPEIPALVEGGLLEESPEGDLKLTERGWMLSNEVFQAFLDASPN